MSDQHRIQGFDGLRALACLAVFGVHLQQLTQLRGTWGFIDFKRLLENGNTGVCILFMLSGFLLSLPFWQPRDTRSGVSLDQINTTRRGSRWLIGYTLRRVGRIVPAYYICLTALVLMGKAQSSTDIALHYGFVHNFREATIYSINDPFWTIAVQAQFYVVFALVMLLLAPISRHRFAVGVVLIVGIVASYLGHQYLMQMAMSRPAASGMTSVIRVSTLAHLPHFFMGMLAALWYTARAPANQNEHTKTHPACDAIVFIAILAILVILAVPSLDNLLRLPTGSSEDRMAGRYNFPYVPFLILIVLMLLPRTRWLAGLFDIAPLRALGVISYGIYLFHLPCLEFCKRQLTGPRASDTPGWIVLGSAGLALTIGISTISYFALERPILRLMRGRRNTEARGNRS